MEYFCLCKSSINQILRLKQISVFTLSHSNLGKLPEGHCSWRSKLRLSFFRTDGTGSKCLCEWTGWVCWYIYWQQQNLKRASRFCGLSPSLCAELWPVQKGWSELNIPLINFFSSSMLSSCVSVHSMGQDGVKDGTNVWAPREMLAWWNVRVHETQGRQGQQCC